MGRLTTGTQDPQEPTAEQMLAAELEHVTRVAGFRAPSEYDRVGYRRDGTVEVYDRPYGPRARMIAAYHPDRPGVPDYAAAARYNAGRREAEDYYRRAGATAAAAAARNRDRAEATHTADAPARGRTPAGARDPLVSGERGQPRGR